MDYPGNFDVPAFPAGKSVAISRAVGVGILIIFALIIFTCGMILWASHSRTVKPIIIGVDNVDAQWHVIGERKASEPKTATHALQSALIANFVRNWFMVSANDTENEQLWTDCDTEKVCTDVNFFRGRRFGNKMCDMACTTNKNLFTKFMSDIVPGYKNMVANGIRSQVMPHTIQIEPLVDVNDNGGVWRIKANVIYSNGVKFDILGYVTVSRDMDIYPHTMGYYIAEFNTYKMN